MMMTIFKITLAFILLSCQSCFAFPNDKIWQNDLEESKLFPNREHKIFNSIGSALRTEASTANPNGMSCFLTYVEKGSILYHGTFQEEEVEGIEWVAFDPNFASIFARKPIGKRPDPKKSILQSRSNNQQINFAINNNHPSIPFGNLRTYTAKSNLRLLYLDGLSAMKRTDGGSMDFQDSLLLFNRSIERFEDYFRSEKLCEMVSKRWNSKIDGFIRKDFEFEIIICSFQNSLKELDRVTLSPFDWKKDGNFPIYWDTTLLPNEVRDDSITRQTVQIDYDSIISVWNYPIKVFNQNSDLLREDQTQPRLLNMTKQEREMVLKDIDELILKDDFIDKSNFIDWQAIIDSIVARYRPVLKAFDNDLNNKENQRIVKKTVHDSIFIYIDVKARSKGKELKRCMNHMYKIPESVKRNPTVTSKSVQTVLKVLCSTLLEIYEEDDIQKSQKTIKRLSKILYWTPWTRHQREHVEPWSKQ